MVDEGLVLERLMPLPRSLHDREGLMFEVGSTVDEVLPVKEGLVNGSGLVLVYIRGLAIPAGMFAAKGLAMEKELVAGEDFVAAEDDLVVEVGLTGESGPAGGGELAGEGDLKMLFMPSGKRLRRSRPFLALSAVLMTGSSSSSSSSC